MEAQRLSVFTEIAEINHEIKQLLRDDDTAPSDGVCRRVAQMLEQLRDLMAVHFIIQQSYGSLTHSCCDDSELADQVQAVRVERQRLHLELRSIVDQATQLAERNQISVLRTSTICRFDDFCEHIQEHETRESELMRATETITPAPS